MSAVSNYVYYELNKAKGLVRLHRHITPEQREQFNAVLRGEARVVYNDDRNCSCGLMPRVPAIGS